MKQKLAIIGANASITMLIEKAKQLGYETHVFAWKCGDPGEKAADFFYPISVDEKETILAKCKEIGIVGVCSITSDFVSPTVNFVARKLGLVSNPEESEFLTRNKFEMRRALKEAGVFTPNFVKGGEDFNVEDIDGLKYPLIVKPTDRWSSKGITRVESAQNLMSAVKRAVAESLEKKAIIEEFIEGNEYCAQCICQNGKVHVLAFIKSLSTGDPNYILKEHIYPSGLSLEQQKKCCEVFKKALKALKIFNTAAHIQFKITPSGEIGIIEIGARMGGGCLGTDLTPMASGMDFIKMVIEVACGKKLLLQPEMETRPGRVKFIMNTADYEDFLERKKRGEVLKYGGLDGKYDQEVTDNNSRHGYYIV